MPGDLRTRLRPATELTGAVVVEAAREPIVQVNSAGGARIRFEADATCLVRTGRGGRGPVRVELGSGCGWFDGTDGAVFEISRPGVDVVVGPATVAVTGEEDGSTAIIAVNGAATVEPTGGPPIELARQAALVTPDGKWRQVIDLDPSDLASDRWVVANRLLDSTWSEAAEAAEAPEAAPADAEAKRAADGAAPIRELSPRRHVLGTVIATLALSLGLAGLLVAVSNEDDPAADRTAPSTTAAPPETTAPAAEPRPVARPQTPPPAPFSVAFDSCRRQDGQVVFEGSLTNESAQQHTYRVAVLFSDAAGAPVESKTIEVTAPGDMTVPWAAVSSQGARLGGGSCDHTETTVVR